MSANKSILIIGDHDIIIWALKVIINETFPDLLLYSSDTFSDGVSLLREQEISLVILDTDIASSSAFEMISMISDIQSSARILVYSQMDESHALNCLIAGADGIISKESPFEQTIIEALTKVMDGKKYINPTIQQNLVGHYLKGSSKIKGLKFELTPREEKIILLLLNGKATSQIAEELRVRPATASAHKTRILNKFKVKSVVELYVKIQRDMPELLLDPGNVDQLQVRSFARRPAPLG